MKVRELFASNVTRDIPPVVYFHEQIARQACRRGPRVHHHGRLARRRIRNQKRVPNGIHEQYVRLLTAIASELDKPGGPELPAAWISGFYGSGKSSFAKLLGLALDGVALPDGRSLAEALLARDSSPRASRAARGLDRTCGTRIDPMAVVFDIGGTARDDEQIHARSCASCRSASATATTRTWPRLRAAPRARRRSGPPLKPRRIRCSAGPGPTPRKMPWPTTSSRR